TDVINIANNVISITNIDAGIQRSLTLQQIPPGLLLPLPSPTPAIGLVSPPLLQNVCTNFRLTSPLDGLPNGTATFYWDPASVAAVYQVVVMNESRGVLAVFTVNDATNVSGDVSHGAIGGGFQLIIQLNALVNGQVTCTDEHVVLRAAPSVPGPGVNQPGTQPTSTPTPIRRRST